MIKALIVEDSGLMRLRIRDVLSADKSIKVVATAKNGKDGLKAIKSFQPDVVITDMVMPEYDGLYLVKEAMLNHPIPIVVLSSLDKTNHQIFEALEQGAFAFLDKPRSPRELGFNKPLIDLVKAASQTNMDILQQNIKTFRNDLDHIFSEKVFYDIVAIGASTGGPGAIESVLLGLPSSFPVPIVIAQHMPPRFLESFATRLDSQTKLKVKLANKGEQLRANHVYLCPGTSNTKVIINDSTGKPVFSTTSRKFHEFNDPSVDCLFESIAGLFEGRSVALLLTGMGKDGAEGMKKIRSKGGITIAQNEFSSIVFGMPKAAIDLNAADYVLDVKEIPGFITSCFS